MAQTALRELILWVRKRLNQWELIRSEATS